MPHLQLVVYLQNICCQESTTLSGGHKLTHFDTGNYEAVYSENYLPSPRIRADWPWYML